MADDLPIDDRLVIPGSDLSVETMRAGGSGGQHVNTTDSAVRLRFDLDGCAVLREPVKARLREAFPSRVTQDGEFLVHCQVHRSQKMNLDQAREHLASMIRDHLRPPPRRKKTRPTQASKRRRLEAKNRRGQVKSLRGKIKDG